MPVTRMVGRIDGDVAVPSLDGCDAVIVRGIPRGSLEQVIFRVDALHALVARGVTVVNGPRAIERTIDKFLASALLARAGVPTPRTIACERRDDALEAFDALGGDVIVKPLFGSMGAGMTRVDDRDVAYRVFHALEIERAVYYLQEALPADRDLRAFVVGGRVLAAIERVGPGWRANLARGAERAAGGVERRAGADVPGGGRGAGHRLRGRRPAGRARAGAQRDPRLARAAGGDRRRRGGGARRARRVGRSSRSVTPRWSAVATSAPAAPASSERAQVLGVAHAAAGEQLEVGEGGVDLGDQRDVRPRAAAHPRQVEDDHLAQPRRGAGAPRASSAGRPASRGSGESVRPSRRSTLSTASGSSAVERAGVVQRLGPDDDALARRGPAAPAPAPAR